MSGPTDNRWCACDRPAAMQCVRCGAFLCRWHVADAPMQNLAGLGVVLRPVCLPGCGATMTRDWVADCQRHAEAKKLRAGQAGAK